MTDRINWKRNLGMREKKREENKKRRTPQSRNQATARQTDMRNSESKIYRKKSKQLQGKR